MIGSKEAVKNFLFKLETETCAACEYKAVIERLKKYFDNDANNKKSYSDILLDLEYMLKD